MGKSTWAHSNMKTPNAGRIWCFEDVVNEPKGTVAFVSMKFTTISVTYESHPLC